MKMVYLTIVPLAALAACATPQQRCISNATAEVSNLQNMLAEVNGNLARGYAYQHYEVSTPDWDVCGFNSFPGPRGRFYGGANMCMTSDSETRVRMLPIDPQAEMRKRDNLAARIAALQPQMKANVAACNATYGTQVSASVPPKAQ